MALLMGVVAGGLGVRWFFVNPPSHLGVTVDPEVRRSLDALQTAPAASASPDDPVSQGDLTPRSTREAIPRDSRGDTAQSPIAPQPSHPPHVEARLQNQRRYVELASGLLPRQEFAQAVAGAGLVVAVPAQVPVSPAMVDHLHDCLVRALGGALMMVEATQGAPELSPPQRAAHGCRQLFAAIVPDAAELVHRGQMPISLRLTTVQPTANRIVEGFSIMPDPDGITYRIDRSPWSVEVRVKREIVPPAMQDIFDHIVQQ